MRSWNVASLFGADVRDTSALRRHRTKVRYVVRLAVGAHIILIQESRGTNADLVQLRDLLPGWECRGTFDAQGTAGGTLVLLSPAILAHYPERRFDEVVLGRFAIVRLRGPACLAPDVGAIHSFASSTATRCQQFRLLADALSPV